MQRLTSRSVLVLLASFAFVSYLLRTNISVGAELMMPDLGLSKIEMGQIFTSFLIGYALFQIPAGILGDRIGPKRTLGISVLVWGVCTVLTGLVGRGNSHAWVGPFASLWVVRFVLGLAQAATYPVGARVVYNWIAPSKRGFANSLMFTGTSLGAAAASPLMSWLMVHVSWSRSFWIISIPAFLLGAVWLLWAADFPAETAVDRRGRDDEPNRSEAREWSALKTILSSRRVVLLCLSYVSEGYVLFIFVFWLYIYLVEVRGFQMLKGGVIAALPWLTGLCFTPIGGWITDRLSARTSRLTGSKYVVMAGYSASGLLLFAAAYSAGRGMCIAALCLSVGFLMAAEAPFWVTATHLSGRYSGTVSAVMNTAGILGGIASTSLIPILVAHFGWLPALSSGAAMAILCSLLWLAIGGSDEAADSLEAAVSTDSIGEGLRN